MAGPTGVGGRQVAEGPAATTILRKGARDAHPAGEGGERLPKYTGAIGQLQCLIPRTGGHDLWISGLFRFVLATLKIKLVFIVNVMMNEVKQEAGAASKVLPEKGHLFALPGSKPVVPHKLETKRKPKLEKTDSSFNDSPFIGQTVHGVVDGLFDAGYLLTVRVGDTDMVLRGVVFQPGLSVPISEANDIAPNVKLIKRDENALPPKAQSTSNPKPASNPCRPISALSVLMPASNTVSTSSILKQDQAKLPVAICSGQTDLVTPQPNEISSKPASFSQDCASDASFHCKKDPVPDKAVHVPCSTDPVETQMDVDEKA